MGGSRHHGHLMAKPTKPSFLNWCSIPPVIQIQTRESFSSVHRSEPISKLVKKIQNFYSSLFS
ncbi:hypothetical protein YC2023_099548 [Brassica napus]